MVRSRALHEASGRELEDELTIHLLVEVEIEAIEAFAAVAKARLFDAAAEQAILSTEQFVADQRRQEVEVRQSLGGSALHSDFQHVGHAREAQLAQRAINFDEVHGVSPSVMRRTTSRYSVRLRIRGSIWRSPIGVRLRSRQALTAR